MTAIQLPNGWRPRDYQRPAWRYLRGGGKRALIVAHRRWGKDDLSLHWTAIAGHLRKGVYWHMLPQANQARKAIWDAINPHTGLKRIDEAFPLPLRKTSRVQDMAIELKCGSFWQLVGSDNYNSLVGTPPVGIVFSEFALADPAAWAYLAPILEENGGWASFITTPRGKNHAYRMLQSHKGDSAWHTEVSKAEQTGVFGTEQLESIKRQYVDDFGEAFGESLFEQEYHCSFEAAVLGSFYARELAKAEAERRICDLTRDPTQPVYSAWDLGMRDHTAIWIFQVRHGGIDFIDYHQSSGVGVEYYRDWLAEAGYACEYDFVPHDARVQEWGSGRTRIETMRAMGLKPRLAPEARLMDGINAARRTIAVSRFDAERCEQGLEALRHYHAEYDMDARILKAHPEHDWSSDPADAFRYAALAWRGLAAPEAPPAIKYPIPTIPGQSNVQIRDMIDRMARRNSGEED